MEEVDKTLVALKAYVTALQTRTKTTPMEERMLVLEKAVKKSLEGPACKTAPSAIPRSGG